MELGAYRWEAYEFCKHRSEQTQSLPESWDHCGIGYEATIEDALSQAVPKMTARLKASLTSENTRDYHRKMFQEGVENLCNTGCDLEVRQSAAMIKKWLDETEKLLYLASEDIREHDIQNVIQAGFSVIKPGIEYHYRVSDSLVFRVNVTKT